MEIFKKEKTSEWKPIIKNLRKAQICDPERLDSISNALKSGRSLFESDRTYLESKIQELQQSEPENSFQSNPLKTISEESVKHLDMIKKLHQKEIGNFSRLESINNYLNDGLSILAEDAAEIEEKYKQLENTVSLRKSTQPQTILIDDFEAKPTHDFDSLSNTIARIVKNSHPHFTVGIYGEWGTGKTTLMRAIETNLKEEGVSEKKQKILSVWFNAWKYEREEHLVTLSLMKTVAYAMADHEKFDGLSKTMFSGLTIFGKDIMQQLALRIISKKSNDLEEELTKKMDYMNKLYRDSIYFDGLDKIRRQMEVIRELEGQEYRIVIFIDDLDRCSPNKALEVLESIKLFLDIEGFAFVIGLSHKTVTQLITQAYQTTGVKGEDYIKKIIQIPIKIPSWSDDNIIDLIDNQISANLNEEYTKFLRQNSTMIAKVVEYNPRQLKRFINNVIIAFETFASNKNSQQIKFDEIFLVKILKKEWPDFYSEFIKSRDFREIIKWLVEQPKDLRKYFKYLKAPTAEEPVEQKNKRLDLLNKLSERTHGRITSFQIDILSDFTLDAWNFLSNVKEILFGIENWKVLDNVMDVVEEFHYDIDIGQKQVQ
jgi:tRNA A37 threonylcarbamoyladenosine biosynthesis protein TsaE